MDMPVIQINSDSKIPIENYFRVSAGPGAGKTHWLISHIKNILHNSDRLSKTRKVACITYTNIAVETILHRLGSSSIDQVEVSTIHSFLYKHIVKPYIFIIANEYDLDVKEIDGHDDHIVSFKKVTNWIETHPNKTKLKHPYSINQLIKLEDNKEALANWLASLCYKFDLSGMLKIQSNRKKAYYLKNNTRHYLNNNCLNALETDFWTYKKLFWQSGILHHDDVLFFSYQLIQKFPFILQVIRAKFPYFFVDEFQDTNPVQAKILEKIGQLETVVGIIGDKAQSIYGFQGAEPEHFSAFSLPNLLNYELLNNYRSTNQIICILNSIRKDIKQNSPQNSEGIKPIIIIGNMTEAYKKASEICRGELIHSLSRDNITSNAMKKLMNQNIPKSDLLQNLYDTDTNRERRNLIIACIKATELAYEKKFKESIKELEKFFRYEIDKNIIKKEVLKFICALLDDYSKFKHMTLHEFYQIVKNKVKSDISSFKSGAAKTFYENHMYQQLAVCVKISEDTSFHRTIHKSKGDEFDNVLLILKEEKDIDFLINPRLNDKEDEEHRINYVAISRAKKTLFVNVPSLSLENIKKLEERFEIINN